MAPVADLLPHSIGPYVGLMLAGFAVAIIGHLSRSRWLVAVGVIMIVLATLLFPLALQLTTDEPPPPGPKVPLACEDCAQWGGWTNSI
jgi:sulfite exporter TauE/SafE